MRIAITDVPPALAHQARAYAEYRVFASLARFNTLVRGVDVALTRSSRTGAAVTCRITLTLDDGQRLRVSCRGRHVYGAINRAAHRSSEVVQRQLAVVSRR